MDREPVLVDLRNVPVRVDLVGIEPANLPIMSWAL